MGGSFASAPPETVGVNPPSRNGAEIKSTVSGSKPLRTSGEDSLSLGVGGWLLLHGKTEVGTVVAFISGLNRMNDPWGDLVNYFRDLTNAGVKYQMIAQALDKRPARQG